MGMRITTGMAMNTYRYNLQNSTRNMSDSRNSVLTQRKFDSFSDDPSSAIQAWRVRRAMTDTGCYQKNNADTYTRMNIAWVTMDTVKNKIADPDGRGSAIYGQNGPTASARRELGKVLSNTAESVIHALNSAKSGEDFIFAGDDELNAPFSWNENRSVLYYRGVNVNAGSVERPAGADPFAGATEMDDYGVPVRASDVMRGTKADGSPLDPPATNEEKAWAAYHVDQGDVRKLKAMSEEQVNVDLGMGLLEDADGKLVPGTYFNRALPGINMLGYGLDADGDPNNICMMMKKLGEIYERCDENTGKFANDQDEADANRLLTKLKGGVDYITGQYVEVDTKGAFLQQNETRLKLQGDYLGEQRAQLEDVDLADAITQFSWDYYCYSAALKVGTQLLSQSLIDYMN